MNEKQIFFKKAEKPDRYKQTRELAVTKIDKGYRFSTINRGPRSGGMLSMIFVSFEEMIEIIKAISNE